MATEHSTSDTGVDASGVDASGVDVSGLDFLPELHAVPRCLDGTVAPLVLASFLASVDAADLLTDAEVLDLAVAWDRLKGWVEARHLVAVAEFARRPVVLAADQDPVAVRAARRPLGQIARDFGGGDEMASALGLTVRGGEGRVGTATVLVGFFPATLAALAAGRIDYPRMSAMLDEAAQCEGEHAAAVEAAVLAKGRRATPGEFRRSVRRAVVRTDPAAARRRAQKARNDLYVRTGPAEADTAWLDAHLNAEDAMAIRLALDAAAAAMAGTSGETRTRDQLRAAALAAPFWAALAGGELSSPGGPIRLAVAHGQAPALEVTPDPLDPEALAELHGYGPITGQLGRAIAARSRPGQRPVVRLLASIGSDEASRVAATWPVEPGYRPSAALRRHIVVRDRTCTYPGCQLPAPRADIDHTRPWPHGDTHPANLGTRCRRHHRFKQHPAVRLAQPSPGRFVWTMPTGHRYEVGPPADR